MRASLHLCSLLFVGICINTSMADGLSVADQCALTGGACLRDCGNDAACTDGCRSKYRACLKNPPHGIPIVEKPLTRPAKGQPKAPNGQVPRSSGVGGGHPNDQDVLQCVAPMFGQRIEIGPAVGECSSYVRLESARAVDRKNNGATTDVIAEINLRVIQNIGGMLGQMCTGTNWPRQVPAGGLITLTKVLSFQVFSTQSICLTRGLQPLVRAQSD